VTAGIVVTALLIPAGLGYDEAAGLAPEIAIGIAITVGSGRAGR
jgi:hypothetical protein